MHLDLRRRFLYVWAQTVGEDVRWMIKQYDTKGGESMLLLIFYHRRAASDADAGRVGRQ